MKLNLGAGDRYVPGWHNVDRADCPHRKDEAFDLRMPPPWKEVQYAYAGHVLEHLRVGEPRPDLPVLRAYPEALGALVRPDVERRVEPHCADLAPIPATVDGDGIHIAVEMKVPDQEALDPRVAVVLRDGPRQRLRAALVQDLVGLDVDPPGIAARAR